MTTGDAMQLMGGLGERGGKVANEDLDALSRGKEARRQHGDVEPVKAALLPL